MKADEFSKSTGTAKADPSPAPVIVEKKLRFKNLTKSSKVSSAPNTAPEGAEDLLGPNVHAAPGSELHRIRKHNPALWTKIQNWD
jgi:hypothetical protein